jgi:hypothetical protein
MRQLLILFAGACLLAGCASPNVNPPKARADAGYVDFYTMGGGDLNWEVACFDERSQKYAVIFSEYKPLPEGVLRLALPPGRHHLRVTFLNRVIREPALCEVEVAAKMVTPVHVVLTEDAVTQVEGMVERLPGSNVYLTDTSAMYRISTVINPPMAYRVKDQMPYAY